MMCSVTELGEQYQQRVVHAWCHFQKSRAIPSEVLFNCRSGVQQGCAERHLRAVTVREIAGILQSLPPLRTSYAWL
jgi:hypothetical protein